MVENYQYVIIDKKEEDKVGIITLNKPPDNRPNLQMFREIKAAIEQLDKDEDVLLIMIKGNGPDFSRGGDVEFIVELKDWEATEFFLTLIEMIKTFQAASKTIMAVIHGWATAAGMVMSLASDLIVASEDAVIGSTAIDFGLYCFFGPPTMLPPIIGPKKAYEMGVTGDVMSAQEAYQRGVINRVVPKDKLEEAAMELATRITAKSPSALLLAKRCFYSCRDVEYVKALEHGAAVMGQYHMTAEAREGMKAFLEKRDPEWCVIGTCSDLSVKRDKSKLKDEGNPEN